MFRIFDVPQSDTPSYEGFVQAVIPQDRERLERWVNECLAKKNGHSIEFQITRPNGDLRIVNCTSEVSTDEEGLPTRLFGACQDITDSRRAQQEDFARKKLESVGMLAGGIAHDFNNLLGGVLAQAELGLAESASGAYPQEELTAIRNVAIRGSEIVRQLLMYAGKESEVLGLVDVSRIVGGDARITESFGIEARNPGNGSRPESSGSLGQCRTDSADRDEPRNERVRGDRRSRWGNPCDHRARNPGPGCDDRRTVWRRAITCNWRSPTPAAACRRKRRPRCLTPSSAPKEQAMDSGLRSFMGSCGVSVGRSILPASRTRGPRFRFCCLVRKPRLKQPATRCPMPGNRHVRLRNSSCWLWKMKIHFGAPS